MIITTLLGLFSPSILLRSRNFWPSASGELQAGKGRFSDPAKRIPGTGEAGRDCGSCSFDPLPSLFQEKDVRWPEQAMKPLTQKTSARPE